VNMEWRVPMDDPERTTTEIEITVMPISETTSLETRGTTRSPGCKPPRSTSAPRSTKRMMGTRSYEIPAVVGQSRYAHGYSGGRGSFPYGEGGWLWRTEEVLGAHSEPRSLPWISATIPRSYEPTGHTDAPISRGADRRVAGCGGTQLVERLRRVRSIGWDIGGGGAPTCGYESREERV
jgi:hypothetical protein